MVTPATAAPPPPSLREALDGFSSALRTCVVKVTGSVEDDEPDTKELADKLLAPQAAWNVGPARKLPGGRSLAVAAIPQAAWNVGPARKASTSAASPPPTSPRLALSGAPRPPGDRRQAASTQLPTPAPRAPRPPAPRRSATASLDAAPYTRPPPAYRTARISERTLAARVSERPARA